MNDKKVAYFCMEYGFHEELPIYAGGLGILAGDYMKSAGDLGLPVVGIGLLWGQGYTEQRIGPDGHPHDEYPARSYPFLKDTGRKVRVRVKGHEVECRIWLCDRYGNAPLYLLEPTAEEHRWITRRLYDATPHCRVAQEILLGIGGVRALRSLGIEPAVYHFNEGHAAFAGVELICERMLNGESFEEALAKVRQKVVFTTHTPVPAGNELHEHEELRALGACAELVHSEMKELGGEPFGMTVAGLRLSREANAVSELHAHTSRAMWKDVSGAAPIKAITNGVHVPTWQSESIRRALADDEKLWAAHRAHKEELLAEVHRRAGVELNPDALIIGFARRAAAYKRADLLLRNAPRVEEHFHAGRLQILFSGKAHPADEAGKTIVASLVAMAKKYPRSVAFLENYDMAIGRLLTRGCDVWLNNPRRPLEASGTSGMKAALNGVLNLSVLDGWWPEGCQHGVNGWAIGNGEEGEGQDERDMEALYRVLEQEVLPSYLQKSRWVAMMRSSIQMSQSKFSADRMVLDYFRVLYGVEASSDRVARVA